MTQALYAHMNNKTIKKRQYSTSLEAGRGIAPHIQCLRAQGILREVGSGWNTPLLPVKKQGSSDYRPVQDLRWVNKEQGTDYSSCRPQSIHSADFDSSHHQGVHMSGP
jgi:hypothetical protein